MQAPKLMNCVLTVGGFAADLPSPFGFEQLTNGAADKSLIVHDEDFEVLIARRDRFEVRDGLVHMPLFPRQRQGSNTVHTVRSKGLTACPSTSYSICESASLLRPGSNELRPGGSVVRGDGTAQNSGYFGSFIRIANEIKSAGFHRCKVVLILMCRTRRRDHSQRHGDGLALDATGQIQICASIQWREAANAGCELSRLEHVLRDGSAGYPASVQGEGPYDDRQSVTGLRVGDGEQQRGFAGGLTGTEIAIGEHFDERLCTGDLLSHLGLFDPRGMEVRVL